MRTGRCLAAALGLALVALPGCGKKQETPPGPRPAEGITTDHAAATGAEARGQPYLASVLREPFHRPDCRWAAKISEANLAGYTTRDDAIADGHRPCKVCRP